MTAPTEPDWARPAPRTITVTAQAWALAVLAVAVPVAVGVGARPGGLTPGPVLAAAAVVVAAAAGYAGLRRRTTRYRIGPSRVELRTGVVLRVRRSVPLAAVHSVDTDAGPLQRRAGLVVVRIVTGGRDGVPESTITINAVAGPEGERLHALLLDGIRSAGGLSADAGHGRLASIDARWARYAPFTMATPVLGCVLVGLAVLAVDAAQLVRAGDLADGEWPRRALVVGLTVVAVLLVGAAAATALFAERWWNYRLDREPGGMLRVRRGLVTVRSVALDEGSLSGVVVDEPLGARVLGAARLRAVCTEPVHGSAPGDGATVLPTSPLPLAHRVAAVLLGVRQSPTAAPLRPHPDPARRHRELSAAVPAGTAAAAAAMAFGLTRAPLTAVFGVLALVATPVSVLLARRAYRNLGHAVTDGFLVTRAGLLRRRTAAIRHAAVTGWTATCGPLQRRRGLLTVTATTASGSVRAADVGESEGLLLAAAITPDLVAPLLEPAPSVAVGRLGVGDQAGVAHPRRQQHQPGAEERPDAGQTV